MKRVLIICFLLALTVFTCKKDKIVFSNPAFTVGKIDFYQPNNGTASEIRFLYYVNGKEYVNQYGAGQYGWTVPSNGNYSKGDKYMAEYDPSKPDNARFLFDYPVNTSSDSTNYVNQFKSHPPSCCLVYACRGFLLNYR